MRRWDRWVTVLLAAGLGLASFVTAYRWSQTAGTPPLPGGPAPARAAPQAERDSSPSPADGGRLLPGAELIQRFVLPSGAEGVPAAGPVPAELVGLDRAGVERARPEWRIQSWSPDRLVVEVPCQVEPEEGFVTLQGDWVAVFEGRPGPCSALRELTDISVLGLARFLVTDLKAGIPFRSEAELLQIMEGLRGEP